MAESSTTGSTILIVGAGVFGASTAYHLAQQYEDPSKITMVDCTPSLPEPAGSNDINKIIRADYFTPFYCDLAYEALNAWATWPELKEFYHRTGWIMLDEEGSETSDLIRKVFRGRGHDPTADIPLGKLDQRWQGIMKGTDVTGFKNAYWNPEAGWCDAFAATAAIMKAAQDRGVEGIATADGRLLTAEKILLATGAWRSKLMSPTEDVLGISEQHKMER